MMDFKLGKLSNRSILLIVITLSVFLRLAAAIYIGDRVENLPGIFDQISYDRLAQNVIAGRGFSFDVDWWPVTKASQPTAHWSYFMTLYLVGVYKLFSHHPLVARLIQAVLAGALTPLLVYRITSRTFNDLAERSSAAELRSANVQRSNVLTVSLIAAGWTALYGYFIYYSAALMTEAFYITAILWTLDCALRITERASVPGSRLPLAAFLELGAAIGLTVLLRQAFLIFVPFLFSWMLWDGFRRSTLPGGSQKTSVSFHNLIPVLWGFLVALVVTALFILPFTIFNYQRFHRFVLLNTNAGYAFFWANHPIHGYHFVPLFTSEMPSYQDLIPAELLSLDEAALDQALMKIGIGYVMHDPLRFLALTVTRIPFQFMFWPLKTSGLISNLTRVGSLGVALPFALIGMFVWGVGVRRRQIIDASPGILLLLFFVVYSSIHLVSWAGIRYRLPVDPVIIIFAANGLMFCFRYVMKIRDKGITKSNAPLDI